MGAGEVKVCAAAQDKLRVHARARAGDDELEY